MSLMGRLQTLLSDKNGDRKESVELPLRLTAFSWFEPPDDVGELYLTLANVIGEEPL